jgi:hypothetical protein
MKTRRKIFSGPTLIGIALLLAGGSLSGASLWTAWCLFEARSWQSTDGVVESVTRNAKNESVVTYRFEAGESTYRSTNIDLGLIGVDQQQRREGETVTVYFDPERPEHCALNNTGDRGAIIASGILGLVIFIIPGLAILHFSKPLSPPSEASLAPMPGSATYEQREAIAVAPGRIGRTRIYVEAWEPGRLIRIKQKRVMKWSILTLVFLVMGIAPPFFSMQYDIHDIMAMNWEQIRTSFLPGIAFFWTIALVVTWPSRPVSIAIDWSKNAIHITSGRRRRILGLQRVRAIEFRHKSVGGRNRYSSSSNNSPSSPVYWQELIVWVEPDDDETAPFLLVSTRARTSMWTRDSDVEAFEHLANALAAHLNVPLGAQRESVMPWK